MSYLLWPLTVALDSWKDVNVHVEDHLARYCTIVLQRQQHKQHRVRVRRLPG